MAAELTGSLQERCLSLLCYDDVNGRVVYNLLDPSLFEGDYRFIAERAVGYWKKYGKAPKQDTADLEGVAEVINDKKSGKRKVYLSILSSMFNLSQGGNPALTIDQLKNFIKLQKTKTALLESSSKIQSRQEKGLEEVENIWNDLLKTREIFFEPGKKLTDVDAFLDFLSRHYSEFVTGIPEFDRRGVVPSRQSVLLFLSATGLGKSWFLMHIGKLALMTHRRVVHITLEMPEEEVMLRYYQSFFSMPKRSDLVRLTQFEIDSNLDRLDGFTFEDLKIKQRFADANIGPYLKKSIEGDNSYGRGWASIFKNIRIKKFPSGQLSPRMLEAYLDNLEVVDRFVPDIVILDYIQLMKKDSRNPRYSIGHNMEEFRGLMETRHCAGVTAQQISKVGAEAIVAQHTHVAEDWSLAQTSDIVVTMSQTEFEGRFGLARLFVSKARSEHDKFGVIITQSYDIGQFVLESHVMADRYWDRLDELKEEIGEEDEEEYGDKEKDED